LFPTQDDLLSRSLWLYQLYIREFKKHGGFDLVDCKMVF
jgi:competence transcription factor ComK